MKKIISKSFMGAMAVIIVAQTTPNTGLLISQAAAADYVAPLSLIKVSKVETIKSAYLRFKTNVDYKLLSANEAISEFTLAMIEGDITEADMAEFVRENAESERTYSEYLMSIETAKANLEGEDFTPEEFGMIAGSSLGMFDQEALKWSGCAGLGVGVVLIIGAVTMGIIALVKSEGEASIKSKYAERKRSLQASHQAELNFINDAENRIQGEINAAQGDINLINENIDQANSDLAYWNGVLAGALNNNDLEGAQTANNNITAIHNQIEAYQADIVAVQNQISVLMIELDNYQTPGYTDNLIAIENASFEVDYSNIESEEQNRLDMVPVEKARAKKLGIAAGVAGAIGIYLAIDGSQDC